MWAEEGVIEREEVREKLKEIERERQRLRGELTPHNPPFLIFFKQDTQYHNHTLKPKHLRQFSYLILLLIFKGINQKENASFHSGYLLAGLL